MAARVELVLPRGVDTRGHEVGIAAARVLLCGRTGGGLRRRGLHIALWEFMLATFVLAYVEALQSGCALVVPDSNLPAADNFAYLVFLRDFGRWHFPRRAN